MGNRNTASWPPPILQSMNNRQRNFSRNTFKKFQELHFQCIPIRRDRQRMKSSLDFLTALRIRTCEHWELHWLLTGIRSLLRKGNCLYWGECIKALFTELLNSWKNI